MNNDGRSNRLRIALLGTSETLLANTRAASGGARRTSQGIGDEEDSESYVVLCSGHIQVR